MRCAPILYHFVYKQFTSYNNIVFQLPVLCILVAYHSTINSLTFMAILNRYYFQLVWTLETLTPGPSFTSNSVRGFVSIFIIYHFTILPPPTKIVYLKNLLTKPQYYLLIPLLVLILLLKILQMWTFFVLLVLCKVIKNKNLKIIQSFAVFQTVVNSLNLQYFFL